MSTRVVSPVMGGILGAVLVASCTIHLGPTGGSGSGQPETTGAGGSMSGGGGAGGFSPEEQAAIDALQHVDPGEVLLKDATAEYAAATCSSLVESQVADPSTVDVATIQQLFDQLAPAANDAALAWMMSVDPSTLPASIRPVPNYECMDPPHNCKAVERCPLGDGAVCSVTGCGQGKCAWCDLFGSLYYDGYCTYACMQGSKYWGYGYNLHIRFAKEWNGFTCFPFPK